MLRRPLLALLCCLPPLAGCATTAGGSGAPPYALRSLSAAIAQAPTIANPARTLRADPLATQMAGARVQARLLSYTLKDICFSLDGSEERLGAVHKYDLEALSANDQPEEAARVLGRGRVTLVRRYAEPAPLSGARPAMAYDEMSVCFSRPAILTQSTRVMILRGTDTAGARSYAVWRLAP